MKVSVIIPTWNRSEELRTCLESVLAQEHDDVEVIVVDNGSTDGTSEMLKERFPDVRLISNQTNVGACAARNQAMVESSGNLLWFLDSDSEVSDPRCLANMLSRLQEDASIGSIGGELRSDDTGRTFVLVKKVLPNAETVTDQVPVEEASASRCDYLATCNCLVKREHLVEWGGFDETYFFLSEDKELGLYLRQKGLKNIASGDTSAFHNIAPASGTRSLYLKLRNMVRFSLLHSPAWRLPLVPLLDIVYLFRGTKFRDLKQGTPQALKYLPESSRGAAPSSRPRFLTRLLRAGTAYILCLAAAYVWNLAHLPQTLMARNRRPNFLHRYGGTSADSTAHP